MDGGCLKHAYGAGIRHETELVQGDSARKIEAEIEPRLYGKRIVRSQERLSKQLHDTSLGCNSPEIVLLVVPDETERLDWYTVWSEQACLTNPGRAIGPVAAFPSAQDEALIAENSCITKVVPQPGERRFASIGGPGEYVAPAIQHHPTSMKHDSQAVSHDVYKEHTVEGTTKRVRLDVAIAML
jgi:hypothetical protein